MKVDTDFSGLDKFLEEAENEIKQGMIEAAHEGVDYAKNTENTRIKLTTYAAHPEQR